MLFDHAETDRPYVLLYFRRADGRVDRQAVPLRALDEYDRAPGECVGCCGCFVVIVLPLVEMLVFLYLWSQTPGVSL